MIVTGWNILQWRKMPFRKKWEHNSVIPPSPLGPKIYFRVTSSYSNSCMVINGRYREMYDIQEYGHKSSQRILALITWIMPNCLVYWFSLSCWVLHCHLLLYNIVIISLNHIVIHCGFCLRLPKLPLHISAAIKPIKPLVVKWCTVVDAGARRNCVIPYCG